MAGRRDIEAGRATILLSLKNNLATGLRAVEKSLKSFEGIANKLGESFVRLGTTMVGPLLAAGLASEKIRSKLDEARKSLTEALEPALLPVVEALTAIVKQVSAWISKNPELVRQWLKIGLAMVAIGAALKVAAASAAILAVAAGTLAAILSSLPAAVLALGALVAAWLAFTEAGRNSLQAVLGWFRDVGQTFLALVNLIAGGSMEAAWELVLSKMTVTWTKFVNAIREGWLNILPEGAPGGFIEAFRATLKGFVAEGEADVKRLEARLAELLKMAGIAVPALGGGGVGELGGGGKGFQTFSAAGASTLSYGTDTPSQTLAEIRAIKKGIWEAVKHLAELAARRDRPGIFRE